MKKILVLALWLSFILMFTGCKKNDNGFTIKDFYDQIVLYDQRLDEVTSNAPEVYRPSLSPIFLSNVEGAKRITREEFLNNQGEGNQDIILEDYYEQLTTTKVFVKEVKSILEEAENIELDVKFQLDDESVTYRFVLSESGFVLIEAIYDTSHTYLKMGLNDDLLEYSDFHYFYQDSSIFPSDDATMNFRYFTFVENKSATYANYNQNNSSLRYTDIENNKQFTIQEGSGILEGSEFQETGYVINFVNSEENTRVFLQVLNDEIIGETYDVFDEYGLVYRFDNYEGEQGSFKLQLNILHASGWDYAIVPTGGINDEINEVKGVYDNENNQVYNEKINYNESPGNGFLGIWLEFDDISQITDDSFKLTSMGMNFNHPKANVAFLNQIRLQNFNDIKTNFRIENCNFFVEDLHQELYMYVDKDIRNDLEGINDEPIIAEGDIEEYETAMTTFNNNLNNDPNYLMVEDGKIQIKDGNKVLSTIDTTSTIQFDLDNLFFSVFSLTDNQYDKSSKYIIDGSTGQLIEYRIENHSAHYNVLAQTASKYDFLDEYNEYMNDEDLQGIKTIRQVSNTLFELEVTTSFFNANGVDIVKLYEQSGIMGLEDQLIRITIEFTNDFNGYTISYIIDNLELDTGETTNDVVISSTLTMIITDELDLTSPIDMDYLTLYLPHDLEDVIFFLEPGIERFVLDRGISYVAINAAELGDYNIHVNGNHYNYDVEILDQDGHLVEILNNKFTSTYEGIYYIKISSPGIDNIDIYVRYSPTPEYGQIVLESINSAFTIDLDPEINPGYKIRIPSTASDRILILNRETDALDSSFVQGEIYDERGIVNNFNKEGCRIATDFLMQSSVDCAFFIPKDTDYELLFMNFNQYQLTLDYQYINVNSDFTNDQITLDIFTSQHITWFSETNLEAYVHFTLTEDGRYFLDSSYNIFGNGYVDARLFTSNDVEINGNWRNSINLIAGEYYIKYTFKDGLGYDPFNAIIVGQIYKMD